MTQIEKATEVRVIKSQLEVLWISGLVKAWEIPNEYLLTRRAPTIVFLTRLPMTFILRKYGLS